MNNLSLILYVGAGLAFYLYLCNRIMSLVQPLRDELAFVGESLLREKELDRKDRDFVAFALDHAFSRRLAWAFALSVTPAIIAISISRIWDRTPDKLPSRHDRRMAHFVRLATLSVLATSPLAALLFLIQFTFWLLVRFPVGRAGHQIGSYGKTVYARLKYPKHLNHAN